MIHITEKKEFHLETDKSSYIFKVLPSGHLGHLYYGKRLRIKENYDHLDQNYSVSLGNATDYSVDTGVFTLDSTKLEIGTHGKGDYKEASLDLLFEDGSTVSDFKYKSHEILDMKPDLEGLPSSFENDDKVKALKVVLIDDIKKVEVTMHYAVFYDCDVLTRSMVIENQSDNKLVINKAMSMNIDFSHANFDVMTLDGKWIRERHLNKRPLSEGVFYIDSKRGVSSSTHNPFLCLMDKNATEHRGDCFGFSLMYSGNHQCLTEVNPHRLTRLQMGINPYQFSWQLEPGMTFTTPEAVMTYGDGLNDMSHHFHDFINHNVISKHWAFKERPVLLNNWEATYFNFNEKKLLKLAKEAHQLGVELFVLDDGWFGKRNDDTTSLGDWTENTNKLPKGLEGLSKKVKDIGLDFGIWVEPEMVSVESDLYKNHPEWAIRLKDREPSFGRNQMILDLSNEAVVDYLYESLSDLFGRSKVTYVKWDMNRNFSDFYSNHLKAEQQRELNHRYVLGLYQLMGRLKEDFPEILFEACSAGGNRFDMGMLYYMPQIWTSDNTDALERQKIQYGTSMVYPLSTMAAHVSAIPSHQVLRKTPIESRFNVAMFGVLGYELDVTKLSAFDKKVMKKQIEYYKLNRSLLQYGAFSRLESPYENNCMTWMVSQKDEAILGYYQTLQQSNMGFESLFLKDLDPEKDYHIDSRKQYANVKDFGELINHVSPVKMKENGLLHNVVSDHYLFELNKEHYEAGGDELMYAGLKVNHQFIGTGFNDTLRYVGDFGSRVYKMKVKP